jgi:hypothetical protein
MNIRKRQAARRTMAGEICAVTKQIIASLQETTVRRSAWGAPRAVFPLSTCLAGEQVVERTSSTCPADECAIRAGLMPAAAFFTASGQ